MKIRIVSIVLAVLLLSVVLPGCVSKSELENCQATAAEQAAQIRSQNITIEEQGIRTAEQAAQIRSQNVTIEEQAVQIAELEAELPKALHDPSYAELMAFMEDETTHLEAHWYKSPSGWWRVEDDVYAAKFLASAAKEGIRGYPCTVLLRNTFIYSLAAFNTTGGWVYLYPAYEEEAFLEVGKDFYKLNNFVKLGIWDSHIVRITIWGIEDP